VSSRRRQRPRKYLFFELVCKSMFLFKCILYFKEIEKDYERFLVQSKKSIFDVNVALANLEFHVHNNPCTSLRYRKMGLTSLHDFVDLWHLYICRSLFGHSTFFVASLACLKRTSWRNSILSGIEPLDLVRARLYRSYSRPPPPSPGREWLLYPQVIK